MHGTLSSEYWAAARVCLHFTLTDVMTLGHIICCNLVGKLLRVNSRRCSALCRLLNCRMCLQWLKAGKVHHMEHLTEGLINDPKAFIGMLDAENVGKAIMKIADP